MVWPVIESGGAAPGGLDVFVRIIRAGPDVGVGIATAGGDIRGAGVGRIHAAAFIIFVPAFEVGTAQAGPGRDGRVPSIAVRLTTVARQKTARVTNILVPIATLELSGHGLLPGERVIVGGDLELRHFLVR